MGTMGQGYNPNRDDHGRFSSGPIKDGSLHKGKNDDIARGMGRQKLPNVAHERENLIDELVQAGHKASELKTTTLVKLRLLHLQHSAPHLFRKR